MRRGCYLLRVATFELRRAAACNLLRVPRLTICWGYRGLQVRADGGFGVSAAQCFDVSAGSFRRAWYDSIRKCCTIFGSNRYLTTSVVFGCVEVCRIGHEVERLLSYFVMSEILPTFLLNLCWQNRCRSWKCTTSTWFDTLIPLKWRSYFLKCCHFFFICYFWQHQHILSIARTLRLEFIA